MPLQCAAYSSTPKDPADYLPLTGAALTGAAGVTPVALTPAAALATDASLSNVFMLAIDQNGIMTAPTNLVAGYAYTWIITQPTPIGGGPYSMGWDAVFAFQGGVEPNLSLYTAGQKCLVSGVYDGAHILCNSSGPHG